MNDSQQHKLVDKSKHCVALKIIIVKCEKNFPFRYIKVTRLKYN